VAAIKTSIKAFGDAFDIGEDMIRDRFFGPSYAAEGIGAIPTLEIAITTTPGGTPSYATVDIVIGPTEVAVFDEDRVDAEETP